MEPGDLLNLIRKGENQFVEFKQIFSSHIKIAKEIIAFANTRGGIIIFGIKDSGKIIGVASEKEVNDLVIETLKYYCEPIPEYQIEFIECEKKEVVVLHIFESKKKPIRVQDYKELLNPGEARVYIRIKDKSVPASKEMTKILQSRSDEKPLIKYQVGKDEKKVFEYLEKNEFITVKQLGDFANISLRRSSRTLIKLVRADLLMIHTKDNGEEFFTYIS